MSSYDLHNVKLVAGRSHVELGQEIAKRLGKTLVEVKFYDFLNTEINTRILSSDNRYCSYSTL